MRFQGVLLAFAATALTIVAGCASTDRVGAPADAAQLETPSLLSRMAMTRDFAFATAAPLAVSKHADASYARDHETALRAGAGRADDAVVEHAPPLYLRTAAELPRGWMQKGEDLIRHSLSGLECPRRIELEGEDLRFLLMGVHEFDAKNLDVGCAYLTGRGEALTLYASFWPQMSLEDSAAGAVAAIRELLPVKGELDVMVTALAGEGAAYDGIEEPVAAAFDIGLVDGRPFKTSLWLVKTLGWHVKARATYAQDGASIELVSAIMFAVSHLNVRIKNLAEPVTQGGEV